MNSPRTRFLGMSWSGVGAWAAVVILAIGGGCVDWCLADGKQLGTIVVLAATALAAVWYADQARLMTDSMTDQAKVMKGQFGIMKDQFGIMKKQFEVQYTPHLRPAVRCAETERKSVIIRLRNLSGTTAIHPGVYPEWLTGNRNAELIRETDFDGDSRPDLPSADFFTLPLMEVDLEGWLCRVSRPPVNCRKVEVRWDELPWGERQRHVWRLEPISEGEEENGWHFVYYTGDNKPSS